MAAPQRRRAHGGGVAHVQKEPCQSKAKRFGEGSAKPIVSAATYGVGGNAFAQAIADPVSTVHSNKPELLVVDGYNVIHCTPRYEKLVYDHSDDPYSNDVHDMARTASSTTSPPLPRAATRP